MSSGGESDRTDNESESDSSSLSPPPTASDSGILKASSFPPGSSLNPYKLAIIGGGPAGPHHS